MSILAIDPTLHLQITVLKNYPLHATSLFYDHSFPYRNVDEFIETICDC